MKFWNVVAAAAVLAVTVVGCGASPATTTVGENSTGSAKQAFTFAMSGEYPPFNYKDDRGKLTGFDVAIGKALAKQMGMTPDPVTNPWDTIIPALQANKFDAILGSMSITPTREKKVSFTNAYYLSGAQIFVQSSNTSIQGKADLKGKVVGVDAASTYETLAKQFGAKVKRYDSDVMALRDLETGRLDAVITDKLVGEYAIKHAGLKLKPVGSPLSLDHMGIAVRKDETDLLSKLNQALKAIENNGTYATISQDYFGENLLTDPSLQG